MSVPELVSLGEDKQAFTVPFPRFLNQWSEKKHCALVSSAFRRLRSGLKAAAEDRGVLVLDAVDGGDTSKNWFTLGQNLQDLTAIRDRPIIVLLDEPKALFEGGDRMSQGIQVAIEFLQQNGWAVAWYAIRNLQETPLPQAYQRMSEWLTRGVPLSWELLAFCSLDHRVSPDEHALDVMGSKGDWKNRFGRVRLTASRAILSSIREILDDDDPVNSALIAISIRADKLDPQNLAPDEGGWGYKDFDRGWHKARITEAAVLWLWDCGRLPSSAQMRIGAMLSQSSALAITTGLRTGNVVGFAKACIGMRRCEETIRACRNILEHSKDAPEGSYQLVGAVLVAAEAWELKIMKTIQPNSQFPADWKGWNKWSGDSLEEASKALRAVVFGATGGLIKLLASVEERNVGQVLQVLCDSGGGLAELAKNKNLLIKLSKDCRAVCVKE